MDRCSGIWNVYNVKCDITRCVTSDLSHFDHFRSGIVFFSSCLIVGTKNQSDQNVEGNEKWSQCFA
jgi:late competence protein required for DNA uptake (superfamily II DNA/RNA helicase)